MFERKLRNAIKKKLRLSFLEVYNFIIKKEFINEFKVFNDIIVI